MNLFTAIIVISIAIIISLVVVMGLDMVLSQTQSQVITASGNQLELEMKTYTVRGVIGSGTLINFTDPWNGAYYINETGGYTGAIIIVGLPAGKALVEIGLSVYFVSGDKLIIPWEYPPENMSIQVYLFKTTLGSTIYLNTTVINVTEPSTPDTEYRVVVEPGTCYAVTLVSTLPPYSDNMSLLTRTGCVDANEQPVELVLPPGSYMISASTLDSLEVKNYVANSIQYVSTVLAAILIASAAIIIIYEKTR